MPVFFFLWKAIIKSNFEILGLKTSRSLPEEIFMFCIFFPKGQFLIFTVESERECDVASLGETVFLWESSDVLQPCCVSLSPAVRL